jgi:hypothetical protein
MKKAIMNINDNINPCIDCITYPLCRNRLIEEHLLLKRIKMKHRSIDWDLVTVDALLYRAAENVLIHKCDLIFRYTINPPLSYLEYVEKVVKELNKVFNLVDENGKYKY